MKFKIFNALLIMGIVPSLSYYTCKFYFSEILYFDSYYVLGWTAISFLILFSLILNCIILNKLEKLETQNKELKSMMTQLSNKSDENFYSTVDYMQNTREIFLKKT